MGYVSDFLRLKIKGQICPWQSRQTTQGASSRPEAAGPEQQQPGPEQQAGESTPHGIQPSRSRGRKKGQIFLRSPEETFAAEVCVVCSKHLFWETRASLGHLLYPPVILTKGTKVRSHCILKPSWMKNRGQPTTSSLSLQSHQDCGLLARRAFQAGPRAASQTWAALTR